MHDETFYVLATRARALQPPARDTLHMHMQAIWLLVTIIDWLWLH
jgi:hypothetical protein